MQEFINLLRESLTSSGELVVPYWRIASMMDGVKLKAFLLPDRYTDGWAKDYHAAANVLLRKMKRFIKSFLADNVIPVSQLEILRKEIQSFPNKNAGTKSAIQEIDAQLEATIRSFKIKRP